MQRRRDASPLPAPTAAVPRAAVLPREIAMSTIGEMEPGERGWTDASAIFVDMRHRVYVDASHGVRSTLQPHYDIHVRRHESGVELWVPEYWAFRRSPVSPFHLLLPATNVEVVSLDEEEVEVGT